MIYRNFIKVHRFTGSNVILFSLKIIRNYNLVAGGGQRYIAIWGKTRISHPLIQFANNFKNEELQKISSGPKISKKNLRLNFAAFQGYQSEANALQASTFVCRGLVQYVTFGNVPNIMIRRHLNFEIIRNIKGNWILQLMNSIRLSAMRACIITTQET